MFVWDKVIGELIYCVIVWQDCCMVLFCVELCDVGYDKMIIVIIGLLVDFYFLGIKLKWLFDNVEGVCVCVVVGELLFGMVDIYFIWCLIGGVVYVIDVINVLCMMFYDIYVGKWSDIICDLFDILQVMLFEVKDCVVDFGKIDVDLFGVLVFILGVVGD